MKTLYKLFFIISLSINTLSAVELNSKVKIALDSTGNLNVSTRYLTNYILRGKNTSNGETGSLQLIKRNTKSINFDMADLEWDGFLPSDIDFKPPTFEYEDTSIDLSKYNYPESISWRNSGLVLRGANLVELVTEFPQETDEKIDAMILFLMNALTVTEVVTNIVEDATKAKISIPPSIDLMEKLKPFADKIVNFQQSLDEANTMFAFFDVFLTQIETMSSKVDIAIADYETVYTAHNYFKVFKESINSLNNVLGNSAQAVSDDNKKLARESMAIQYEKLITKAQNDTVDIIIDKTYDKFEREFSNATTETDKLIILTEYMINPLVFTIDTYKSTLENDLKELKSEKASQSKIDAKKKQVNFMKNGYAIIQLARFLFATDDFVTLVKESPQKVVPILFDISYAIVEELITIDNLEVLSKKTLQKITGADGRSTQFRSIGNVANKANTYMSAFKVGAGVGNKMIPLLWDLVLGQKYLESSIVDGKISTFGTPQTNIRVDINNTNYSYYDNAQNSLTHYIPAKIGDKLSFYATLYRPFLFDATRSPWELNTFFEPQSLYQIYINTPSKFTTKFLCAKKVFGDLDFSIHNYLEDTAKSYPLECGEGTILGSDKYENKAGSQILYNSNDTLLSKYKIKTNSQNISEYIESIDYIVTDEVEQIVRIKYDGFQQNRIDHIFHIVPPVENVDFTIDASTITENNLSINFSNTNIQASSTDSIESIKWTWGDGTTTIQNNLQNTTHQYSVAGNYAVNLDITAKSGLVYSISKNINVQYITTNQSPISNAGLDQTIKQGTTIVLDGSSSTDSDGTIVSYEWKENNIILSTNANFSKSNFTTGTHTITLTITDNDGATSVDNIIIIVNELTIFKSGDTWKGLVYKTVTSPYTNRIWLDRNLGAYRVCLSYDDETCFGDYYQWGRNTDGHEKKDSNTTSAIAFNTVDVGHGDFILSNPWSGYDNEGTLIASTNWLNNNENFICPVGFKIPSIEELNNETINVELDNRDDVFNTFLKLPSAGARFTDLGLVNQNIDVYLWSSSQVSNSAYSNSLWFSSDSYLSASSNWSRGQSIRCIGDDLNNNLEDGLVAHYKFENNTNDSIENGNNGTEYGGINYIDGAIGKAVSFDGIDDYIAVAHNPTINFNSDSNFSISLFVKMDTYKQDISIFEKWRNEYTSFPMVLRIYDNRLHFASHDTNLNKSDIVGIEDFNKITWQHVVATKTPTSIKMYLNGLLIDSNNTMQTTNINNTLDLIIGCRGGTLYCMDGAIDDFRIYNKELNSNDIINIYNTKKYNEINSSSILHNGFNYETITSSETGKIWLDKNLGASRVCISHDDSNCYGDYYQWGRETDGHEKITSSVSEIQANSITPSHENFIKAGTGDWTSSDINGTSRQATWNPCPIGFNVPIVSELLNENIGNRTDAFNKLKLPSSGYRHSALLKNNIGTGTSGYFWSRSLNDYGSVGLYYDGSSSNTDYLKSYGFSIRCIKNN